MKTGTIVDTCYTNHIRNESHQTPLNKFLQKIGQKGGQMTENEEAYFESMRTSSFVVRTIGGPVDPQALNALLFAVDIWSTEIVSGIPIKIDVSFENLPSGTLATTSRTGFFNVPNAPDPSVIYNPPLADALAGFDLSPTEADITIRFNANEAFYYGTDGLTPQGQIDFVSLSLHEIGHGMGMSGTVNGSGTMIGLNSGSNLRVYDQLVELGDGTPLSTLDNGSATMADALRSEDIFMNAPSATAALGSRPKLYAPTAFAPGSSYSHWDEDAFPNGDANSLMSPIFDLGESNHDIGDIFRGLLNDIGWSVVSEVPAIDAAMVSVDAPKSGKALTNSEPVTITIGNLGELPIGGFDVAYRINGGIPVFEFFTGTIAAGDIAEHTFSTPADLSEQGTTYLVEAGVFVSGDERPGNDFNGAFVTNFLVVDELPYFEDFENGENGWRVEEGGSWQLGTPSTAAINGAASGTKAWATNLTGNYPDFDASILRSPSFDLSGLTVDPLLSFALHTEIEEGYDGLSVQMSMDDGLTWQNVGQLGDPGWYTANLGDFGSTALDFSGGNGDAFSGSTGSYIEVAHFLEGAAGEPSVQLRFVFGSDFTFNEEGAAIDDISIAAPAINGSLVALRNPVTGAGLSATEQITVSVLNAGTSVLENFQLALTVDGSQVIVEEFATAMASQEIVEVTFQHTLDMSQSGIYELSVDLILENDEVPNDNTITKTVTNFAVADNTFPYVESFENGTGGWFAQGTNSSWEIGTPNGPSIQGASDGSNAWATNLDGPHNTFEQSFVISPVFDFSQLSQPTIFIDISYDLGVFPADPPVFPNDVPLNGVAMQYSTDLGATWTNIGELGDPDNWYNANITSSELGLDLAALEFSGGNGDSWSSSSDGYLTAIQNLSELAGTSQVQLRLVLGTIIFPDFDSDGFAFDNLRIVDAIELTCTDNPAPQPNAQGACSAEVSVVTPIVTGSNHFALTNNYNGTDDASDTYPVGTTQVVWTATDLTSGLTSTCTSTIVVEDGENPTISSSDIQVTAGNGETSAVVNYELPAIADNCSLTTVVSHSTNLGLPFDGGTINCPFGANSYLRVFDPQREFQLAEEFVVTKGIFGVNLAFDIAGQQDVTLNIYSLKHGESLSYSNLTLLASEIIEIPNIDIEDTDQYRLVEVPIQATIPKGSIAVMEVRSSDLDGASQGGRDFGVASNMAGQTSESYIAATECGVTEPIPLSALGFPEINLVMGLESHITPPIYFLEGRGPGAEYPIGTSTETYGVIDRSGRTAVTSFDITVSELPFTVDLVDAPSGNQIRLLQDGDVIDVMDPETRSTSIVADFKEALDDVGSVVFELNGEVEKIENFAPYAIAGDFGKGGLKPFQLSIGTNVLTVTTYTEPKGEGTPEASTTITFEVINGSAVTNFTLIDAMTGLPIRDLTDGDVVDIAQTPEVSVEAHTDPLEVGSVVFELNGDRRRPESFRPYSLAGDRKGDYQAIEFEGGIQTLKATPYELKGGQGSTGEPLTVSFDVVYGATVAGVDIVNTASGSIIGSLVDGGTIDLVDPEMEHITLVANTAPLDVGSVEFILDGKRVQTENALPYAIAGEKKHRLHPFDFGPGAHELVVKTYSKKGRKGIEGGSTTIHFNVTYSASINKLNIVDTKSKNVLSALDGAVINVDDRAYKSITVLAETMPLEVGSVEFVLDGKRVKTENNAPYAIAGDSKRGEKLRKKKFKVGVHELTVTPYSAKGRKGIAGEATTVTFEVISSKELQREDATIEEEKTDPQEVVEAVTEDLTVYPVPFTDALQFALHSSVAEELQISLLDFSGRTVLKETFRVIEGANHLTLDVTRTRVIPGIYLVRVAGEQFGQKTLRVIKK